MRRLIALLLAFSLVLLGAACGGDDGGGDGTASGTGSGTGSGTADGEALSQEEFVAQANEICEKADTATEDAFQERFGAAQEEPKPEEVEEFVRTGVVPIFEDQIEDMRGLTPPEDRQEEFDKMLDDAEAALDDVRGMSGEEIMNEENDPFAGVNAQAQELGLTACSG